jgi:GTP-binding protein EngB required for normal cell division
MFWFFIPIAIAATTAVVAMISSDNEKPKEESKKPSSPASPKSIFQLNLHRLESELTRSKSVKKIVVMGQPGAGKSSLLRSITDEKISPLPEIGIKTDATNWADNKHINLLHTWERYTFVDVPGYDTQKHPVKILSFFPFKLCDIFIFVINGKIHESDETVFRQLCSLQKKVYIVRSFSDTIENSNRIDIQNDIHKHFTNCNYRVIFASNKTREGIWDILQEIIAE